MNLKTGSAMCMHLNQGQLSDYKRQGREWRSRKASWKTPRQMLRLTPNSMGKEENSACRITFTGQVSAMVINRLSVLETAPIPHHLSLLQLHLHSQHCSGPHQAGKHSCDWDTRRWGHRMRGKKKAWEETPTPHRETQNTEEFPSEFM